MSFRSAYGLVAKWNAAARFADRSSEEVLGQYLATRDEEAFRELVRRHAGPVWAVCRRGLRSPDLAEDAFQATFLALVRSGHQIRQPGSVAGWLDKTARRTTWEIRRKEERRAEVEAAKPARDEAVTHDQVETIRQAVEELPDLYRLPVAYRFLAGMTPVEVARELGVPEQTGRTRLRRGVEMLREKLAGKTLAIGAGAAAVESAVVEAAERVPLNLMAATVGAAKGVVVHRGLFEAVVTLVTFRRAVVGLVILIGGVGGALISSPGTGTKVGIQPARSQPVRSPLLAIAAALGMTTEAPAQTFTLLASTSTPIPNGTGNFTGFDLGSNQIASGGNNIIFVGTGTGGQQGFYSVTSQGMTRIVDVSTPIPNGTGSFRSLSGSISISSTAVAFGGFGNDGQLGVYGGSPTGGPLIKIMDTTTPIPNGAGNFTGFQLVGYRTVQISGNNVAFLGSGSNSQNGIYLGTTTGGPLTRIYDTSTPVPFASGNFSRYLHFNLSGTTVAFVGRPTTSVTTDGVYVGTVAGGPVARIADTSTITPNHASPFTGFSYVATNGVNVAFNATSNAIMMSGVYSASLDGTGLIRIADRTMTIPGTINTFTSFGRPTINDSVIAFTGNGPANYTGIFTAPIGGGPLTKVLASGDVLDGKVVASTATPPGTNLGTQAFDGSRFAFFVAFTDGTQAVYTFTPVPEPNPLFAVAGALAAGIFVLRR